MGRCSLTVALPILSAAGIETVAVPVAVLSNHTQFKSWSFFDLTDLLTSAVDKWADYRHDFDAIYTGYVGEKQGKPVLEMVKKLRTEKTIVVVDPAMADDGKLYPGFSDSHIQDMKALVGIADVIVANLTEACLLTGTPYPSDTPSESFITDLLKRLAQLGPKEVLITGVGFPKNHVGCRMYCAEKDSFFSYDTVSYKGRYHGTGDVFASALVGALLNDIPITDAIRVAHDFTHAAIRETEKDKLDGMTYGVEFEKALPKLITRLRKEEKKTQE